MRKKYLEYQRKYCKTHAKERTANTKIYHRKMRERVLEILGGKCVNCGFNDYRALQVDHVHGGGLKDKKSITANYWKTIINSSLDKEGKYQLLCANCNWIKRFENKEHRNQFSN